MGEIKLRAEEARGHAKDVSDTSNAAFDSLNQLIERMNGLSDSFAGLTQERYMEKLAEWKKPSDDLLGALNDLGLFLNGAANTIEQVDQDMAAKLG